MDRMEIIEIPGYIDIEKIQIGRKYLLPKSLAKNGLPKNAVKYSKAEMLYIANCYAREAGVRHLEKNLDKIHRKIVREMVEAEEKSAEKGKTDKKSAENGKIDKKTAKKPAKKSEKSAEIKLPVELTQDQIVKYLGKPIFPEEEIKKADQPGMSVGLAWTSLGGDVLVIEAVSVQGQGELILTGQMGDVMKESATIAFTTARRLAIEKYDVKPAWFKKNQVHLHIPEGATPKDGPSAGITMAVALLSLFRNQTMKSGFAMTGELSLTGHVLPIGGLKEKTVAANHNKTRNIIIPKQNLRDLDDIPDHVKKAITFHPVTRFEEVLELVLG
jgi:ATP-dependent Lon protease